MIPPAGAAFGFVFFVFLHFCCVVNRSLCPYFTVGTSRYARTANLGSSARLVERERAGRRSEPISTLIGGKIHSSLACFFLRGLDVGVHRRTCNNSYRNRCKGPSTRRAPQKLGKQVVLDKDGAFLRRRWVTTPNCLSPPRSIHHPQHTTESSSKTRPKRRKKKQGKGVNNAFRTPPA